MTSLYRVRTVMTGWTGSPGLSSFYFRPVLPDVLDTAEALAAVGRVRSSFAAGSAVWPSTWHAQVQGQVDVITVETGQIANSFSVAQPAVVDGTTGINFGATPVGLLLRLNTSTIVDGQRLQGRFFAVPVGTPSEPDGSPQALTITALQSMGTALLVPNSPETALAVWSRPRAAREATARLKALPARAGSSGLVTGTTVQDKFVVLRSRRD